MSTPGGSGYFNEPKLMDPLNELFSVAKCPMFYGMIILILSRLQKKGTRSHVQGPPIGVDIIPQNLQIPHAIYISFTYIWTQFISYLGNYLIVLLPYFCSNMEDFLPMSCIGQRRIFFLGIQFFSYPCPYEVKLLYVRKASKCKEQQSFEFLYESTNFVTTLVF